MRIAIIEDDREIVALQKIVLSEITDQIDHFDNGWKGLDAASKGDYQLIILDIMMPGINGKEVCKQLRKNKIETPILMVTAKSEIDDKVDGLEAGADDYITKPFSNKELIARVKALLRRFQTLKKTEAKENHILERGTLMIDPTNKVFNKAGKEIELTQKEFDLMYLLMDNPGRSFSRIDLLERVWGENFEGLEHTVNSNINRLRMKIEDDISQPKFILTVWGVGYKLNKEL